jgi:hypothetical protein
MAAERGLHRPTGRTRRGGDIRQRDRLARVRVDEGDSTAQGGRVRVPVVFGGGLQQRVMGKVLSTTAASIWEAAETSNGASQATGSASTWLRRWAMQLRSRRAATAETGQSPVSRTRSGLRPGCVAATWSSSRGSNMARL